MLLPVAVAVKAVALPSVVGLSLTAVRLVMGVSRTVTGVVATTWLTPLVAVTVAM